MRDRLRCLLVLLAAAFVVFPAYASFHLMKVVEVFLGSPAAPNGASGQPYALPPGAFAAERAQSASTAPIAAGPAPSGILTRSALRFQPSMCLK